MSGNQSTPSAFSFLTGGFKLIAALVLLVLVLVGALPMTWQQQAVFAGLMLGFAFIVSRIQAGRVATLLLVMLSMAATARYAIWRVTSLHHYLTSPWHSIDRLNAFFMLLLLSAELYSFLILYLGYMQTVAPLRRPPVLMPSQVDEWPTVDVMIPTFNEPLDVVRYTVLAAKQLDWPAEKLNVWLLDDGDRAEFRVFAEEAGVGYFARHEHSHAKAGNINFALQRTTSDFVAIFDCDHVPTRSFLQVTAGWFLRDEKLGMMQTPHHYYSPDPFERNLGHFRSVPNEGELFYGVIQDTNDFWNATFFCGSCAVLRRSALDEVGGIAQETVTEDAHTSLRLQQHGWNTAYINLAQAAGLATDTLGDHVRQRVRWARGMVHILRIDNPLFSRKLNLAQRLCYLNAMLHFLYAMPRLIFLTAPILYLVFGKLNIPGYWLTILTFAVPHLILSMVVNSRIQGMKRHSFWNEIYETVLSPYILLPTLFTLISPRFGGFNVTTKGRGQHEDYFDGKLARPFVVLLLLNLLGLVMAVPRYLYWDPGHTGTIVLNAAWSLFNIAVISVAISMCWASRQRRGAVRVPINLPVSIECNGVVSAGRLDDISVGGIMATASGRWRPNESVRVSFPSEDRDSVFSARIIGTIQNRVRLAFRVPTMREQEAIARVLYLKADRWLDWTDGRKRDSLLGSFFAVLSAAVVGTRQSLRLITRGRQVKRQPLVVQSARMAAVLVVVALLFFFLRSAHGATTRHPDNTATQAAQVNVDLPLNTLGATSGIQLDRVSPSQAFVVDLPSDALIVNGVLHLKYTLPKSDYPTSTVEIVLNDMLLAAVTPGSSELVSRYGEATIPLPADLLVNQNRLTLRLANPTAVQCSVVESPTAPIQIDPSSSLSFQEQKLALANDLSLLPEPLLQRTSGQAPKLPVIFANHPSSRMLEATGVLVSWLGAESKAGQTDFPVSLGSLPKGNAVVMLLNGESIPALQAASNSRPHISMVTNPVDPFGKLLVLSANTPEEMLELTQALALRQVKLTGEEAGFESLSLPGKRSADDAPRWINSSRVDLETLNGGNPLHALDLNPLTMYLRFSPDFDYGPDKDMYLHLVYSNDANALDPRSSLTARLNGAAAESAPVRAGSTAMAPQEMNVSLGALPASDFANTLQMQFHFIQPVAQGCGNAAHVSGSIGKDSYLDLGSPVHLAQLPDLHLFSVAGFPYTRMADLSDSVILLPRDASNAELTLYLDLLSYFGMQTGYPALRVQVNDPSNAAQFQNKNLLMIGDYNNLGAIPSIASDLPLSIRSDGWKLTPRARLVGAIDDWFNQLSGATASDPAWQDGSSAEGVIEQIESPYSRDHSALVILGRDSSSLEAMTAGLMAELPHNGITGTVSLWHGGSFVSHKFSTPSYFLGDAGMFSRFKIILPRYLWVLFPGMVIVLMLLSLWLDACIKRRIRARLMGVEFDLDGNANATLP